MPTDNLSRHLMLLSAPQRSAAREKLARCGDRLSACPVGADADIAVVEVDGRVAVAGVEADLVAEAEAVGSGSRCRGVPRGCVSC
jgi:hypothetical protein